MSFSDFVSAYPGALDDQAKNFLISSTAGTDAGWSVADLWARFFDEQIIAPGAYSDRLRAFLLAYLQTPDVGQNIDDLWGAITGPYTPPAPPDPYGPNLFAGNDFQSGWNTTGSTTIQTATQFTTVAAGGIYRPAVVMTPGKTYLLEATLSNLTASGIGFYDNTAGSTGGATLIASKGTSGAGSVSGTYVCAIGGLYIRNSSAGIANLSALSIREVL